MHLSPEAEAYFERKGCVVLLKPTPEAIRMFNRSRAKRIGTNHLQIITFGLQRTAGPYKTDIALPIASAAARLRRMMPGGAPSNSCASNLRNAHGATDLHRILSIGPFDPAQPDEVMLTLVQFNRLRRRAG